MNDVKQTIIPEHVGLILDGNRRWAAERNLPSSEGHAKGFMKVKAMPAWFFNAGVKTLSIYAFSTENWKRSRDEVNFLMKLIKKAFQDELENFHAKGCRLLFSGRVEELPGDLPEVCVEAEEKTKNNTSGTLNVCLNYGGRAEIVDALKKMIHNKISPEQVHEGSIKKYLYQSELSSPDIIVRTSGEQRLSGFLLWQSAYSELLFMQKYWPDFEKIDVEHIINEYASRQRKFGGD